MGPASSAVPRHRTALGRRAGRRRAAALLTLASILALGAALDGRLPEPATPPARPSAATSSHTPRPPLPPPHAAEVQRRFEQAVVMLHARQHGHALTALHSVLALAPQLPEAHANAGFALLGLERAREARDFFEGAIALAPGQANAYYGLALAWEASGDLAMATGAMRSYLHLARDERPEHLRRARAALWEWEQARALASPPSAPGPPAAASR
ncbi:MAG: hypothetical protein JNL30_17325 [Rubrivivax sp.]|nr:hypothetical protein [Rubrivivax sp.]